MKLMMVVILEPEPEGLIEFVKGDAFLNPGEKTIPDRPEKSFHLSARGAVVGLGMDKGDAGQGAASSEKFGGEAGSVIDVESFGDAVGEEGLLEDEGQGADGL